MSATEFNPYTLYIDLNGDEYILLRFGFRAEVMMYTYDGMYSNLSETPSSRESFDEVKLRCSNEPIISSEPVEELTKKLKYKSPYKNA